ncbi:MAG: MFS transporter [Gemmatimonadaceae bacterium]|nr:MFS transporter [Gemmatimonadaceae bacterium]
MLRIATHLAGLPARLERDVKLYMAGAALIGFSAFGIYAVLFNLYLLRMGYGVDSIGQFNAAGLLAFALFSPVAGNWGRRAGCRRALVGGAVLMVAGYLLMSLAGSVPGTVRSGWIAAVKVATSCGFATYMVNSSPFLMQAAAAGNRSLVFSLRGAVWPLFGFAGSALGGALPQALERLTGGDGLLAYQLSLLAASLSLAPSLVLFGSTTADTGREQPEPAGPGGEEPRPNAPLLMIGLISLLAAPGVAVARTFFNVYLDSELGVPPSSIGWLIGLAQLLSVPAALVMPQVLARVGHTRVFTGTTLGIALALLPMALIPRWEAAGLGYVSIIVLIAVRMPAFTVFHQELVSTRWRPTMSAVTTSAALVGFSMTSFGGGRFALEMGYAHLFLLGVVITCVSVVPFRLLAGRQAAEESG